MPVYPDSRYATGRLIDVEDQRSDVPVEMIYAHDEFDETVPISSIYTMVVGDRLDQLAFRFGGDSTLWWVLAEVNNIFGFPLFLAPGTKLKIPDVVVFQNASVGKRA